MASFLEELSQSQQKNTFQDTSKKSLSKAADIANLQRNWHIAIATRTPKDVAAQSVLQTHQQETEDHSIPQLSERFPISPQNTLMDEQLDSDFSSDQLLPLEDSMEDSLPIIKTASPRNQKKKRRRVTLS